MIPFKLVKFSPRKISLVGISLLLTGCTPKSLPNNSRCLAWQQAGVTLTQSGAMRRFLALGTVDSTHRPSLDYKRFCVQYIISERRNFGLFRISQPSQPTWRARFFIHAPRHLFLLYPHPSLSVRTYTVEQALADRDCQLSESTKQDIRDYIKSY